MDQGSDGAGPTAQGLGRLQFGQAGVEPQDDGRPLTRRQRGQRVRQRVGEVDAAEVVAGSPLSATAMHPIAPNDAPAG